MKISIVCEYCGDQGQQERGAVNRAIKRNARLFCSKRCAGLARRDGKTREQRVAEKAAYDREYRARDPQRRKAKKAAYHQRTHDPDAAREHRKAIREWHRTYAAEYRMRPEWKEHKREYDRQFRASEFGEFAECYLLLIDLEKEVRKEPWYERAKTRGYYDNHRTAHQRKFA